MKWGKKPRYDISRHDCRWATHRHMDWVGRGSWQRAVQTEAILMIYAHPPSQYTSAYLTPVHLRWAAASVLQFYLRRRKTTGIFTMIVRFLRQVQTGDECKILLLSIRYFPSTSNTSQAHQALNRTAVQDLMCLRSNRFGTWRVFPAEFAFVSLPESWRLSFTCGTRWGNRLLFTDRAECGLSPPPPLPPPLTSTPRCDPDRGGGVSTGNVINEFVSLHLSSQVLITGFISVDSWTNLISDNYTRLFFSAHFPWPRSSNTSQAHQALNCCAVQSYPLRHVEGFFQLNSHLDGIMHKWSNPHFDDFEKKSRCNMKYRIKRINTN